MRAFLARRWFLLVVVAGALVVWLAPGGLRWTRPVNPSVTGAVAIFLTAWGLETRRLVGALVRPLAALWAVAVSFGLLPALAWLAGPLLPPGDLRLGLMVMAAVPCTLASAVIWTRLAGGDEATALCVTLLTNLTGWLATTAWLTLATAVSPGGAAAPALMGKLLWILVLPLGLGQALRAVGPLARAAARYKPALGVTARLLTLVIMLKAAFEVRDRLDRGPAEVDAGLLFVTALACLAVHLGALAAAYATAAAWGFPQPTRIAVALAGSQKTLPVALILFDAYYTAYPLAVVPMVFFHVGQLVVDTFIADWFAGRAPARPAGPPPAEVAAEAVI